MLLHFYNGRPDRDLEVYWICFEEPWVPKQVLLSVTYVVRGKLVGLRILADRLRGKKEYCSGSSHLQYPTKPAERLPVLYILNSVLRK